jgi:putative ABC transport system substrate-binding protein
MIGETLVLYRHFLSFIVFALALTLLAFPVAAQGPQRAAKVGELWMSTPDTAAFYREPFRAGLRNLGYREGANIVIIARYAEGKPERIPALVDELVAEKVDVMLLIRPAVPVAQKRAPTIPVVCAGFNDPVAEGVVASLARPGVNVTGLSWQSPDSAGKRLELAKELIPNLRQMALIYAEGDPSTPLDARATEEAARQLGIVVTPFSFRDETSLETTFATIQTQRPQLMFVISGPLPIAHRKRLTSFALETRIPLVSEGRDWAAAGALVAYGPDGADIFRRAADYVDKILRGAKAAELPIEQPRKFELAVNQGTARAIGFDVPKVILRRADVVIP